MIEGSGRPKESQNYDDSGYFSIQVLQKALEIWGLELIPWKSKEMEEARLHASEQVAYICNLSNHWFTLRRFAKNYRWYNLDSTQPRPTYLSEEHLKSMLLQIENQGYSIFVVRGHMDPSKADMKALELPKPVMKATEAPKFTPFTGKGYSLGHVEVDLEDEDAMLARAIAASLEPTVKDDMDEMRRKRLARFGL